MSARDEMMKTLVDFTSFPGGVADEVLQNLSAAGYRILAPGSLCPETLEAAAKVADTGVPVGDHGDGGLKCFDCVHTSIAHAIRAMKEVGE